MTLVILLLSARIWLDELVGERVEVPIGPMILIDELRERARWEV